MKRLASIAVAALLLLVADQVSAAPASHWAQLNEALTPPNLALRDDLIAYAGATTKAVADAQALFYASLFDFAGQRDLMDSFGRDLDGIQSSMAAVKADATKGIAVLDSFKPEQCSAHFTALEYTMFAAWLESMTQLQANEPPAAYATAIWLSGISRTDFTPLIGGGPIDLAWDHTHCAGPKPAPRVTPAPSTTPAASPSASPSARPSA